MTFTEAADRDALAAVVDETVGPGEPWTRVVTRGQVLRIVDLEGNQAVDTLLYNAHDTADRYSAADTVRAQGNIFLTTGSQLLSSEGTVLATIVGDTCGRHDTSGARAAPRATCAGSARTRSSCTTAATTSCTGYGPSGMGKRDIVPNINFFMNVPVTADGHLDIVDGISRPARTSSCGPRRDTLVVISNCPQLNNPCNGWNPTPIRLLVWDPA